MSLVTLRRCDQCGTTLPSHDERLAVWLLVQRRGDSLFIDGDQVWDFCSTPCVAGWAHSRELVMGLT